MLPTVHLRPGREGSVLRYHPWIFSGAILEVHGNPGLGDTVDIIAGETPLGRGAWSPESQIQVRVWSFDPAEEIGPAFFRGRLARAIAARGTLAEGTSPSRAGRLVNAESDFVPGLIVDRYGAFLVCQFLAAGAERWKGEIIALLRDLVPCAGIYERSDVAVREKEGLLRTKGMLWGEPPPERVEIEEHGCRYRVDLVEGHKTGFYLDQSENRLALREWSPGAEVLNGYAYSGAFAVSALAAGAERVCNIDSSASALALATENYARNEIAASRTENVEGDVPRVLRQFRDSRRKFDLAILDPPKFAESKSQLERASRGYKDINLLAIKLLRPGGILMTFSCSGLLSPEDFQWIVASAARDAARDAQILRRLGQAADHPTALSYPEGTYLKGLVCRVW